MKPVYRRHGLDEELRRLNSERNSTETSIRQNLELDLKVHQIELEMQNEALKDAQHEIERSRDRYATLYDFSPIGFVTLDKLGIIKELNLAAAAILGRERSQLVNSLFLRFVASGDQLRFQSFLHSCQCNQATILSGVHMPARQQQPLCILELHGHRLPPAQNAIECCQLAIMDITQRRQAEEALQKSHDELEARVKARTAELCQSNQALKELSFHLQQVREEERTRIAREIHDELGGALTAIKYDLCTTKREQDRDHEGAAGRHPTAIALIDAAIHSLRRIITNLRPSILDEIGLWAALDWQAHEFQEQSGIPCAFKFNGVERELAPDRATAVFRIVQEALTNIARHAGASHVIISARATEREFLVKIQDNGKGITREQVWNGHSFGIRGMHERARAFRFSLRFAHPDSGGTIVTLRGPLAPDFPAAPVCKKNSS